MFATTKVIELRDYQLQALEKIQSRYDAGVRKQLLSAATGAGKTLMFACLIEKWIDQGKNALILAHRDRLVTQSADRTADIIGAHRVGVVNGSRKEWWTPCVAATIQSAIVEKQLESAPLFDLVVIDEAHRAGSDSYAKVVSKLLKPDGLLLGVTATPNRGDPLALVPNVFDELVFEIGMKQLINEGHLCQVVGMEIKLPIDLKSLRTQVSTEGVKDFRADDVQKAFEQADWLNAVTAGWKEAASGRRTIVFVPPGIVGGRACGMAHTLAEHMAAQGIAAAAVDGTTPQWQQDQVIKDFTEGRLQVLVNVNIFTEGLDIPPIDCVLFARLTQSSIIYSQAIGRGTRLFPGKENCLVIDITGMTDALAEEGQTLMTLGRILPTKEQEEAEAKIRMARAKRLLRRMRHANYRIYLNEPLGVLADPPDIKSRWRKDFEDLQYELMLVLQEEEARAKQDEEEEEEREKQRREINSRLLQHQGQGLQLREMDPGKAGLNFEWKIFKEKREAVLASPFGVFVIRRPDPEGPYFADGPEFGVKTSTFYQSQQRIEDRIVDLELERRRTAKEEAKKKAIFDDPYALWRDRPVSDKQKALAARLFISLPPNCTAGTAKDLISAKLNKRPGMAKGRI